MTTMTILMALLTPAHAFDPTPSLTVEGGTEASFPSNARFVGDVNGDGYDELAVERIGAFDLYYGGPAGPAVEPDLTWYVSIFAQVAGDVAPIGDVNGDGYGDVAVGVPGQHEGDDRVHVYHGSAFGLPPQPTLVLFDSPSSGLGTDLAHGDLDGDGYDDLVVSLPGHQAVRVYLGGPGGLDSGSGSDIVGPAGVANFGADLAVGDADGDGALDVLIGSGDGGGMATLALGDGTGASWSTQLLPHDGVVALVDFDGDGAATPVTASGSEVRLHVGAWPDPGSQQDVYTGAPGTPSWVVGGLSAPADVDGDGLDDLVVGAHSHRVTLYGGTTIVVDDVYSGDLDDYMLTVSVGDVDGDGRADLVGSYHLFHSRLLRDAWGVATERRWGTAGESGFGGQGLLGSEVFAVGDVDGDGLEDAGMMCLDDTAVCVHSGSLGGLDGAASQVVDGGWGAADVNGDGLGDLLARTDTHLEVYLGAVGGPGAVPDQALAIPTGFDLVRVFSEDVNGDGFGDVVMIQAPGEEQRGMRVAMGSATGLRSLRTVGTHPGTFAWDEVAFLGFADLDGDGFPDLVASTADQTDLVWLGGSPSGPGGPPAAFGLAGDVPTRLLRGDFDGDGFDDVVLSARERMDVPPQPSSIVYGSAAGPDLSRRARIDGNPLWAGDLDGDGRDDLVCGRNLAGLGDGEVSVHHGTAAGLPTAPDQVLSGGAGEGHGWAAVGADVDGDGLMELLVGAPTWRAYTGRVSLYQP